jgi:molecular chaperone Hsp33
MKSAEDLELTDPELASDRLLYRLFHEDGVRVFEPKTISFSCPCNRDKIKRILLSFDSSDRKSMIEDGEITARCDFCNTLYSFDPAEIITQLSHT